MRIYCPSRNIQNDTVIITDKDELHYFLDVLRLKAGSLLSVFDGCQEYECEITGISRRMVKAKILSCKNGARAFSSLKITLAVAIPKKAKIDDIIDKCTQLGVDKIIPLFTERTIVKFDNERAGFKIKRWRKIAQEASKQSGRVSLPVIESVMDFKSAVEEIRKYDFALIPNLQPENRSIRDCFVGVGFEPASIIKSVLVFIGPEGDWTEKEIALAKNLGAVGVSLGNLVLRVDTAAIAVVAFLTQVK